MTETPTPTPQPRPRPQSQPAPPPPPPAGPKVLVVAISLGLLGVLMAWNSWERDFSRPDEPRAAELARQVERGHWLVPLACGTEYLDSPPLLYWLSAGFRGLLGLDPRLGYRLPVVLFAVLGLWLTYLGGKRLFDGRVGFLAMVVQASTYQYFRGASWLDDDLPFAVCLQLAVTSFAILTRKGSSARWAWAGWLGLAGCALTKSAPLGFALAGMILLFFLFFEGGVYAVQMGIRRARRPGGPVLFLLLVLPWYAFVAIRHGQAFLEAHIVGQHLQRLVGSPFDPEPPYYYLGPLVAGFLPWALFLPLAFVHAKDRLARHGERLCLFWFLLALIALSLVSSKKAGYLLVIWPPLSLLIAAGLLETREWFGLWETFLRQGVLKFVPVLMKIPLVLVLLVAAAYFSGSLEKIAGPRLQEALADRQATTWGLALAAAATGLVFWRASRVRRLVQEDVVGMAAFELACAALFLLFVSSFFAEGMNTLQSSRTVLERFDARIPARAPVAIYGRREPETCYYLDLSRRPFQHLGYPDPMAAEDPELARIREFVERPAEVFVITTESELNNLVRQFSSLSARLHLRESGLVGGGRTYVLLSNRPGS